jgi:hypothetical protein
MDFTQQDPQGLEAPGGATPEGPAGADDLDALMSGLVRTSPWARFMAVLQFIGVGLMCLVSLAMLVMGLWGASQGGGGFAALMGILVAVVYALLAAIPLMLAIPLNRFASDAAELKANPSLFMAASAIEQSRKYWKRLGILTIVYLALVLIYALGMLVFLGSSMGRF